VARATTNEWGKYYETADERRHQQGGDPLKRHLDRYVARQRILFLGSSFCLAAVVTAFCVVLAR